MSNMLSLCQVQNKFVDIEFEKGAYSKCDTVYVYDELEDEYFTIDDIRIDSEGDIVIDIKRSY